MLLVTVPSPRHGCCLVTAKLEDRLGAEPKFPDVPTFPLSWVPGLSGEETLLECWWAEGPTAATCPGLVFTRNFPDGWQ